MRWGPHPGYREVGDNFVQTSPLSEIKQIPIYKQFDSIVEFDLLLSPTTLIVLFGCFRWWEANKGGTWKHFFTSSHLIRVPKKYRGYCADILHHFLPLHPRDCVDFVARHTPRSSGYNGGPWKMREMFLFLLFNQISIINGWCQVFLDVDKKWV